jgi:hypothetical protein
MHLWVSKTGLVREDWRIRHGTKSRVAAGCECDLCKKAARSFEIASKQPKEASAPLAVGMTDVGWIVLQIQRMAEDRSIPAAKRARARWWYQRLTYADSASATSIVQESGGRRRSHNARRLVASDLEYSGDYKRPLIQT